MPTDVLVSLNVLKPLLGNRSHILLLFLAVFLSQQWPSLSVFRWIELINFSKLVSIPLSKRQHGLCTVVIELSVMCCEWEELWGGAVSCRTCEPPWDLGFTLDNEELWPWLHSGRILLGRVVGMFGKKRGETEAGRLKGCCWNNQGEGWGAQSRHSWLRWRGVGRNGRLCKWLKFPSLWKVNAS